MYAVSCVWATGSANNICTPCRSHQKKALSSQIKREPESYWVTPVCWVLKQEVHVLWKRQNWEQQVAIRACFNNLATTCLGIMRSKSEYWRHLSRSRKRSRCRARETDCPMAIPQATLIMEDIDSYGPWHIYALSPGTKSCSANSFMTELLPSCLEGVDNAMKRYIPCFLLLWVAIMLCLESFGHLSEYHHSPQDLHDQQRDRWHLLSPPFLGIDKKEQFCPFDFEAISMPGRINVVCSCTENVASVL
jgi:hypothetical protein